MEIDTAGSDSVRSRALVRVGPPVIAYGVVALVVTAIRYVGTPGDWSLANVWPRVDGFQYLEIAREGYRYAPTDEFPLVAWFPGYPTSLGLLGRVVGDVVPAGVALGYVAGLLVSIGFWNWMIGKEMDRPSRYRALALLLLFAWGWYLYGAIYSDALFLAMALGVFLLADARRIWPAAALAGLASGFRPTGLALAFAVLVFALEQDEVVLTTEPRPLRGVRHWVPVEIRLSRLRAKHLAVLGLSLWGLLAYSTYLARRWGNPLLWVKVQENWSQGPSAGPASWLKLRMAARIIRFHEVSFMAKSLSQAAFVLVVIVFLPAIGRRFGWAAGAYVTAIVCLVIFGSNDFVGAGRYMLASFPFIALAGELLGGRPALTRTCLLVSGAALCFQTFLFARGAYLT